MKSQYDGVEGCYLLHFHVPLHHASHYIGWAKDIGKRVRQHKKGTAYVALTRAVCVAGIEVAVVRIWEGEDRNTEKALKEYKNARRICPICNPESWQNNAKGATSEGRTTGKNMR